MRRHCGTRGKRPVDSSCAASGWLLSSRLFSGRRRPGGLESGLCPLPLTSDSVLNLPLPSPQEEGMVMTPSWPQGEGVQRGCLAMPRSPSKWQS